MVVAVDGPSGVGKSTVSARVAADLGLPHLDTGATYRAATVAVLRADVDARDDAAVTRVVARSRIAFDAGRVTLDGHDITDETRSDEVTAAVSAISAIPAVRTHLVGLQQAWVAAKGGHAVVEGRDIGTVVFPDAPVKIFLTAATAVRASRRAGDSEATGKTIDSIAADLTRRDRHDSTRQASPLEPATDAHVIDTSTLTVDQVVDAVLIIVEAAERTTDPLEAT